jgi:hypothetical protein
MHPDAAAGLRHLSRFSIFSVLSIAMRSRSGYADAACGSCGLCGHSDDDARGALWSMCTDATLAKAGAGAGTRAMAMPPGKWAAVLACPAGKPEHKRERKQRTILRVSLTECT